MTKRIKGDVSIESKLTPRTRQLPKMELEIYIVGASRLQNELLAGFLENSTGLSCKFNLNPPPPIANGKVNSNYLVLWDCKDMDINTVCENSMIFSMSKDDRYFIALFNVAHERGICNDIFKRNVRGIFFEHDPLHLILKGVQTIINGDIWFSRKMLKQCLYDRNYKFAAPTNQLQNPLTPREKEILIMVALCNTNSEIADAFNISPYTVKSHIYNIFKKIDVSNRIQASFWAANNL